MRDRLGLSSGVMSNQGIVRGGRARGVTRENKQCFPLTYKTSAVMAGGTRAGGPQTPEALTMPPARATMHKPGRPEEPFPRCGRSTPYFAPSVCQNCPAGSPLMVRSVLTFLSTPAFLNAISGLHVSSSSGK